MDLYGVMVGLENIAIGAMAILMAGPLIRGEVKMNRWYGVRIKKAFESEENWKKINNFGGRQLKAWGTLILAAGIVALFMDLGAHQTMFFLFLMAPLFLLVPAWRVIRYAKRIH